MVTLLSNSVPVLAAISATGGHVIPAWAKGNVVLEKFVQGGPIMYPIVATLIVAIAVILERIVWWTI